MRAQLSSGNLQFPRYEQEGWVRVQRYQQARWTDLIELWTAYNRHLLHVLSSIPRETLGVTCRIGDGDPLTLAELIEDYVSHLEHHLRKMLGEWPGSVP